MKCQHCSAVENTVPFPFPVLVFLPFGRPGMLLEEQAKLPMTIQCQVDLCEDCRNEALDVVLIRGTVMMPELAKWLGRDNPKIVSPT